MAKSKPTASTKARRSRRDRDDSIHVQLVGARAAIMTAVLCLQGKGVFDEVSLNLRRAALLPIDEALAALE